jgi:hypothetical protein
MTVNELSVVKLGNEGAISALIRRVLPVIEERLVKNSVEKIRWIFPDMRIIVATKDSFSSDTYYAVFENASDAVEFKLKYMDVT